MYRKCSEKITLYGQKIDECCLGLGRGWGLTANGHEGVHWHDQNALKPEFGDECTTL